MPPPSPVRRSARGAPTVILPPPPASTASSSSLSSSRQDRIAKIASNAKSETPHSLSSEEASEPPRRSQRTHQQKEEDIPRDNDADDEPAEGEELTRCICGFQDYPGAPLSQAFTAEDLEDPDAGALFIQCDGCLVWQHGGCVGIVYEQSVPDKYYCERCAPKRHDRHTDSKGQKYSLYLEVNTKTRRKQSVSKNGEKTQKERDNMRASLDPATGRRRVTMRSKEHDDEEEQIQRAIEESKREVGTTGNTRRIGKRSREESEDSKHDIKRQRRTSEAVPTQSKELAPEKEHSIGESVTTPDEAKARKEKAEPIHSRARQAELREKEKQREQTRAEAAGRRQERAGRRRVEDEGFDEAPKLDGNARQSSPVEPRPASPPTHPPPEKISHKKGGGKKVKRLGNNQYTNKNRDVSNVAPTSSPQPKKGDTAKDINGSSGEEPMLNGSGHQSATNGTSKKSPERGNAVKGRFGRGKNKGMNGVKHPPTEPAELTLAMMKHRMEAMAAFVAKAKAEEGGSHSAPNDGAVDHDLQTATSAGGAVHSPTDKPVNGGKRFEDLSASEMGLELSKSISSWQAQFSELA